MLVNSTIEKVDFNDRSNTLDIAIDLKLNFNSPKSLDVEAMSPLQRESILNVIQEFTLKLGKAASESQEEFVKVVNSF